MYIFTQFFRLGSICGMAFKLKTYQLLPQKCVTLWDDILDIIGPVKKWPPKMGNLFFKQGLSHFERLKVCTFMYVNGLNPVMFFEWANFVQLLSNEAACRECQNWFNEFKNNTTKWKHIYHSMFTTTDTSILIVELNIICLCKCYTRGKCDK